MKRITPARLPNEFALRFGLARVKDETLVSYVRGLNFERDVVLALRDAPGNIVALAHAARYEVLLTTGREARAEVSFSVVPSHRGRGLARLLMRAIIDAAAGTGITQLWAQCLGANRPMQAVFQRSGWSMEVEAGDVLATLALQPRSFAQA